MGLDVYLLEKEFREAENAYNAAWESLYEREDSISEEEFEAERNKIGEMPGAESRPEVPSHEYPKHLFNRRYLRSSYNDSGFNRAVPKFLGRKDVSLDGLFEPVIGDGSDYEYELTQDDIPGLEEVRRRATKVARDLAGCDPLQVSSEGSIFVGDRENFWPEVPTEDQVLAWFREQKQIYADQKPTFFGEGFSSAKGTVFGFKEGLEVLAIAQGRDVLGRPCPIIVYRSKGLDTYVQSAEIVAEFCDEAIELIKRDGGAYIIWSG
jgi:hypothetical protein